MHRTHNPTCPAADTDIPAVDVTPADIMRGAAHYLELHGWNQRDYYTTDRPFPAADVIGAIGMAAHGVVTDCPQLDGPNPRDCNRAFAYLRGYLIDLGHIVIYGDDRTTEPTTTGDWNDRDAQSAALVIATLRAAADEYDWQHASEYDLESYDDACAWREEHPTRDGYLAWRGAR